MISPIIMPSDEWLAENTQYAIGDILYHSQGRLSAGHVLITDIVPKWSMNEQGIIPFYVGYIFKTGKQMDFAYQSIDLNSDWQKVA